MNRDLRKGLNESWFRGVNERLEQRAGDTIGGAEHFELVCECAREECTERIGIDVEVYESIRRHGRAFIVMPGHVDPTCEAVWWSGEGFEVVEKFGEAGVVAEVQNPRDGNGPLREQM
jgi:hypothetical protein